MKRRARLSVSVDADAEGLRLAVGAQVEPRQQPLGQILLTQAWIDGETLAEAISVQADLPRARVSTETVRSSAALLSPELCFRLRVLPLGTSAYAVAILPPQRAISSVG